MAASREEVFERVKEVLTEQLGVERTRSLRTLPSRRTSMPTRSISWS
jgi:hypothetical protein